MTNFKKICKLILVAAFFCTLQGYALSAQAASVNQTITTSTGYKMIISNGQKKYEAPSGGGLSAENFAKLAGKIDVYPSGAYTVTQNGKTSYHNKQGVSLSAANFKSSEGTKTASSSGRYTLTKNGKTTYHAADGTELKKEYFAQKEGIDMKVSNTGRYTTTEDGKTKYYAADGTELKESYYKDKEGITASAGSNGAQKASAVAGCAAGQGIFSGLIDTGSKIFKGLRDLIYVVAGFGIIGVAVGGFFGNLNWKWLGAIVISLVVIATTGELISAITGCQNFTNSMITDTLK